MSRHLKIVLTLVFIYNLLIYSADSTKHNIIRGEKFICGTYAPELVNVTCKFKRINRTTEFWSLDSYYGASNINNTENLYMNVTVFSRQQNLEWKPHMIVDFIVDVCRYMDKSLINKFMDIFADDFKKSSNFMHPCPYVGHKYLRNMTFEGERFPSILPPAEIYVNLQYFMYVGGSVRRMHYLRPYLEVKTKGIIYF